MDLKKSTKYNQQNRTDQREVYSRPKGVNQSRHSRSLNRRLQKIHQETKSHPKVVQELLRDQWENNSRPQWFITLLWNDLPTQFEIVTGHSGTFRNVLLTQLMGCNSPTRIPDPPERPSLIFMQERKPVIRHGRQILAFHTHLHLGALPDPQNHLWYLDHLIHQKVSPRVQKLLKTTSEGNRGVVIKPWVWDNHAFYNLKDYYSYRHHQDPDLVLDYQNSDLVF